MRCRFCSGRQPTGSAEEDEKHPGDPVCLNYNRGGAGHNWMGIANPITVVFHQVIDQFWLQECGGDPSGKLASFQLIAAKAKLDQHFVDLEDRFYGLCGLVVRLQFEKPPRRTAWARTTSVE
jgi:hypothetical protein